VNIKLLCNKWIGYDLGCGTWFKQPFLCANIVLRNRITGCHFRMTLCLAWGYYTSGHGFESLKMMLHCESTYRVKATNWLLKNCELEHQHDQRVVLKIFGLKTMPPWIGRQFRKSLRVVYYRDTWVRFVQHWFVVTPGGFRRNHVTACVQMTRWKWRKKFECIWDWVIFGNAGGFEKF